MGAERGLQPFRRGPAEVFTAPAFAMHRRGRTGQRGYPRDAESGGNTVAVSPLYLSANALIAVSIASISACSASNIFSSAECCASALARRAARARFTRSISPEVRRSHPASVPCTLSALARIPELRSATTISDAHSTFLFSPL